MRNYPHVTTHGKEIHMAKALSIDYVPSRDVWVLRQGQRVLEVFRTLADAQERYPFVELYSHA